MCWDLVLRIITLQSQVEGLQRLFSNLKLIKTTEVARKYPQHSVLHSDIINMKPKHVWTLKWSQSSETILQPRRISCRNTPMTWRRRIKLMLSWVSKEEHVGYSHDGGSMKSLRFPESVLLCLSVLKITDLTNQLRNLQVEWQNKGQTTSATIFGECRLPLWHHWKHVLAGAFPAWCPPAFSRSQRATEDKNRGVPSRSGHDPRSVECCVHVNVCVRRNKKKIIKCHFSTDLQDKLNQTDAVCSSYEQRLKGECTFCWLHVPAGQQACHTVR